MRRRPIMEMGDRDHAITAGLSRNEKTYTRDTTDVRRERIGANIGRPLRREKGKVAICDKKKVAFCDNG